MINMSQMPVNMYLWSVCNCIVRAETSHNLLLRQVTCNCIVRAKTNHDLLLRQVTAVTKMHGIFGIYSQTLI